MKFNIKRFKLKRRLIAPTLAAALTIGLSLSAINAMAASAASCASAPVGLNKSDDLTESGNSAESGGSLSNDKICWGQGVHFDDLNRPQDAVTAQEKYGDLGAQFIDLSGDKVIYLTFDEGYENGYTAQILDVLKEKGVSATFFVTGDYAKSEGELVQRMIDEGHVVGNHTWKHYSMPEKSSDVCIDEITTLHDYVKENFNYEMTVFRPPMGEFSEQTLALTQEQGYTTMLWSFAYKDWDANSQIDSAASLAKLEERLHCGAIYLLHAVSSVNADILGEFIDYAQSEGYTFVLPE